LQDDPTRWQGQQSGLLLIKLLEQRAIPYYKVGSHRRIRFQELIAYKKQRDAQCSAALDELAQMTQEAGFYAEEAFLR
jgi:hypothetical protein